MGMKMMRWRSWPPFSSKKFEVKMIIHQIKGLDCSMTLREYERLAIEVKWKGSKGKNGLSLSSFRKSIRKNFTREEALRTNDGVVEWNEEFFSVCNFSPRKNDSFHPWEVTFTVFNGLNRDQNGNVAVLFTGTLNLADFGSKAEQKDIAVCVPLEKWGYKNKEQSSLYLSVSLLELRTSQESPEMMPRSVVPIIQSPDTGGVILTEKNGPSTTKSGLGKLRFLKALSVKRAERESCDEECSSDGKSSARSDGAECIYPLDMDPLDDSYREGSEESDDIKSLSYGTLADVNHAGQLFYSSASSSEDEDLVYYTHQKRDPEGCYMEGSPTSVLCHSAHSSWHSPIRSILPWRKRKLSLTSNKVRGEPLLKKHYGDEGGDDIDFDRRQLHSSDESTFALPGADEGGIRNPSSVSEFGDDNFAVGSWEQKDLVSRDGRMKLQTKVFFASIDQRSERAAGESACTALVAVIADWLQFNHDQMPIKSQFDSLIREGSLEWRNLCENGTYRERFPDKHFDLETVLQATIRPISVVPEKSFIGFFHPDGMEAEGLDFLQGAMSFDNIWDEISRSVPDTSTHFDHPLVYIVSWNDHFFVLKVDHDAFYIIDTLGERLYEGCNQAFILKFDRDTIIRRVPDETPKSDDKNATDNMSKTDAKETVAEGETLIRNEEETTVVCAGKESCKEYIKSFLAAIPIRELQADLKKGRTASAPLHQRLQIEFHYTKCLVSGAVPCSIDAIANKGNVTPSAEREV